MNTLLVVLFCALPQSAVCTVGNVNDEKYESALKAITNAWDPVASLKNVRSAVKSFTDLHGKFAADVATLAAASDNDDAVSKTTAPATKLLGSFKKLEDSLNDVVRASNLEPFQEVLKTNFKYIVGKCFTTEEALKSELSVRDYNCKDGGKILEKCVSGGDSPKPELAKVWSYYETEGIRKKPHGLCLVTRKYYEGHVGVAFFMKTFKQWGGSDTGDRLAELLFSQL